MIFYVCVCIFTYMAQRLVAPTPPEMVIYTRLCKYVCIYMYT